MLAILSRHVIFIVEVRNAPCDPPKDLGNPLWTVRPVLYRWASRRHDPNGSAVRAIGGKPFGANPVIRFEYYGIYGTISLDGTTPRVMLFVEVRMTVNQTYWSLIGFMVTLMGFMVMVGCLFAYPGSMFWGEAWIYGGAATFTVGGLWMNFAPFVCD